MLLNVEQAKTLAKLVYELRVCAKSLEPLHTLAHETRLMSARLAEMADQMEEIVKSISTAPMLRDEDRDALWLLAHEGRSRLV